MSQLIVVGPCADAPTSALDKRRTELQHVIVSVLRRHPDLNYFQVRQSVIQIRLHSPTNLFLLKCAPHLQGYHDIISVLLLVLDDPIVTLPCAERMSLYRLRDYMGPTLEPVLAYLRLMRHIVRLADPDFAHRLDDASDSLPHFSLSWVLTLLAHDVTELSTVSRFV